MKILWFTCGLALVGADQIPPLNETSRGEWEISYIASSNREKINENGPFQDRSRKVESTRETWCRGSLVDSLEGRRASPHLSPGPYAGKNEFQILHVSNNALIGSIVNVDKNGKVTQITTLLGNGKDIPQEDISKFKKVTREKRFPEGNIVNILKIGNVTIFFSLTYHSPGM
uniref:Lipocalin/cytosolic fatty-acid binding domain-containing protein n=1 Tax=Equus asinus TaxID=9793 RepID=A0A9L0JSS2_EQUAS